MARNTRRPPALTPLAELTQLAIDLDLTALGAALPAVLARAERESLAFTDFALCLLRTEATARQDRRLERGLRRAHLGTVAGLDGYNFAIRPQLDARVIKEICNGRFVEERRNIICLGKPGLGKTRIAKAFAHAACLAGHSTLCVTTAAMLEDLHAAHADGSFKRAFRRYVKPALLVCDEFGYEPFDARATTYLFRLVSARHGQGSIVLTANTGFTKWKTFFPSESQAVATVDRLVDGATILRFTGESCRAPKEIIGAPLDD